MEELPVMPMKTCCICGEDYPLVEYFRCATSKDGHGYACRNCSNLETQYRNMKTKYSKDYRKYLDRHRMIAKRYQRLIMGMTPREAARDEMRGMQESN